MNQAPPFWDEACAELSARDPVIARLIAAYPAEFVQSRGDAFYTLARSIAGQQISVKAADSVWSRVVTTIGIVRPEQMLAASVEELRGAGLSGRKVEYMHALARWFAEHPQVEAEWAGQSDEEIIRQLTAIRGIGQWTVEMLLIFHLLRPDVWPVDDIGLQKGVSNLYFGGERQKLKLYREFGERFRPWRSVVTWYFWRVLDPLPVAY